jgi:hypothetical protein
MSELMLEKGLSLGLVPVQGDLKLCHLRCGDGPGGGVIHAENQVAPVNMPVL